MNEEYGSEFEGVPFWYMIPWGKIGIFFFGIIFFFGVIADFGNNPIFSEPRNEFGLGDVRTNQVWNEEYDASGNPIYIRVVEKCVAEEKVLWASKGCTQWQDISINMSASDAFKLFGTGMIGIAHGEYVPIPGTGPWVDFVNAWRSVAWSVSISTDIALSAALLFPIFVGAGVMVIIALLTQQIKAILYISVLSGVLIMGTMTLHGGGRGLLFVFAFLGFFAFIAWLLRRFTRTRVVMPNGASFDFTSFAGDQPQLPGGNTRSTDLTNF